MPLNNGIRRRHTDDLIRTMQGERMPGMTTSAAMRKLIEGWEGCPPTSYLDVVGVLSGGFGHTGPDVPPVGTSISKDQADKWLASDLARFEKAVTTHAKSPTQGQFDAMVSFAYNLGEGALEGSTLLKKHNAGDFAGAADEFLKWNHAGGRVLDGLTRRREGERAVYLSGASQHATAAPTAPAAPVLPASPAPAAAADDPPLIARPGEAILTPAQSNALAAGYRVPDWVMGLQAALKAQGFDPGIIDGDLGQHSLAAYAAYRKAHVR